MEQIFQPTNQQPHFPPPMNRQTLRVLLVEDDEDDFFIVDDLLSDIQDTNYELTWVNSYNRAVKIIYQEVFDVCLVDYRLGDKTGLDLLAEIKENGCDIPVILLTGMSDRQVDLAAMQAGAADFLVKGKIDAQVIERAIRYAIERTRLIKALNDLAIRDDLTGLYNRREMKRLMDEEIERYQRYGHPLSLTLLDIDHFKRVNDTYGHPVGDQVLNKLAQIIRESIRSVDRPIRYGGEEFAIILPETPEHEAYKVAERLRENVATGEFVCELKDETLESILITISLGIAELPGDAAHPKALVNAADQALYSAKNNGRNQTKVYREIDQKTKPVSSP